MPPATIYKENEVCQFESKVKSSTLSEPKWPSSFGSNSRACKSAVCNRESSTGNREALLSSESTCCKLMDVRIQPCFSIKQLIVALDIDRTSRVVRPNHVVEDVVEGACDLCAVIECK